MADIFEQMSAPVATTVGKTMTTGGAAASVLGMLTVTEWCAVGGLLCAAIGVLIQKISASAEERRKTEIYRMDMKIKAAELKRLTEEGFGK